jgi:hypothetical protein
MSEPTTEFKLRDILRHLIGKRVLDISEDDEEDVLDGKDSFVQLMFEDGNILKFFVADNEAYRAGAPFCFSNPNTKPKEDDGLWHPTPEEQAAGNWAVVPTITELGEVDHILPTSEPLHALDDQCWCGPDSSESGIVTHNLGE